MKKFIFSFLLIVLLLTTAVAAEWTQVTQGKSYTVSAEGGGQEGSKALDGDKSTAGQNWYNNGDGFPTWIRIDINSTGHCIGKMEMIARDVDYTRYFRYFYVEVSDDDINWVNLSVNSTGGNIIESQNPDNHYYNYTFNVTEYGTALEARYVRLTGLYTWVSPAFAHSEIQEITFYEDSTLCVAPTGRAINMSNTLPENFTQYKSNLVSLNTTVNSTTQFNASLYINGTFNQSFLVDSGQMRQVLFNVSFTEGAYSYYINVSINSTENKQSASKMFFVDSVSPTIAYTFPVAAGTSLVYGTLNTNITFTDDNLYRYNYNVTYPNGSVIQSFSSNTTMSGHTSYQINHSLNLNAYLGQLQADSLVCDSHTALSVNYGDIRKANKELYFDGVEIYQPNKGETNTVDYTHRGDRYNFKFGTVRNAATQKFLVRSPDPIEIVQDSNYKGHLVTGDKWIDFEINDLKNVIIERISSNVVQVTVTLNNPTKEWIFNSIGDLNCVSQNVAFYALNTTETFDAVILSGQTYSHVLNVSYNASYMNGVTGTLYWNNTAYVGTASNHTNSYLLTANITPALDITTNISFNWVFSSNGQNFNTSNKTQEIQIPDIDSCTAYTTRWVNYTLYDELSGTKLSGDMTFLFSFDSGSTNNTHGGNRTGTEFTFCMNPSDGNFTADIVIQYGSAGYANRTYFVDDYQVDANLNNLSLYLLPSNAAVDITIHLIDGSDADLGDYLVEAYRYDIASDTDILVQTEKTDSNGNAILSLTQDETQYSFKMYDIDNKLVLQTTRFKLFDTSYEFVIQSEGRNPLSERLHLEANVASKLTYNNNTNLVNYSWSYSGTLVENFCLKIIGNDTTWVDTCSTDMTGSLTYTITTFNVSYMAYGQAVTTSGSTYNLRILGIDTRISIIDIITTGTALMIVFIIFLFVSLIGIINKSVAVTMGIASLIFLWLFGLLPIGWVGLMGAISIGIITLMVLNKK